MRLSVIVPHYFVERRRNLGAIVSSIQTGSAWPDEILVWDNTGDGADELRGLKPEVLVVRSPRNVGAQARLIAALMARGERLLFLDNDVAVQRRTIENLLQHSLRRPDDVVTLEGRIKNSGEYRTWTKMYGRDTKGSTYRVDLSLGRGEMVRRDVLLSVLSDFPFAESTRMDDLHLSAAYQKNGVSIYVVPCVRGESDLADLPMYGRGMCHEPGFYEERTRVARTIACDPEVLRAQAESPREEGTS